MIARRKVFPGQQTTSVAVSPKKPEASTSNFPEEAPALRKDQLPDKVDISSEIWTSLYATLRDYPDGIDQANLAICNLKHSSRPLGGNQLYDKCHVKSIPELLVSIPYINVKEMAPSVVGFYLLPVSEWSNPPSLMSKYRSMEKIVKKSTLQHQQARCIPSPKSRDFESDDEDDLQDFMRLNFKLPPQPAYLLKPGTEMPESLRYSIYYLLAKDHTDGVDVLKFNMFYQKYYKHCINAGSRCRMSLHGVFMTMSDLVHYEFRETNNINSMWVWPKSRKEILAGQMTSPQTDQFTTSSTSPAASTIQHSHFTTTGAASTRLRKEFTTGVVASSHHDRFTTSSESAAASNSQQSHFITTGARPSHLRKEFTTGFVVSTRQDQFTTSPSRHVPFITGVENDELDRSDHFTTDPTSATRSEHEFTTSSRDAMASVTVSSTLQRQETTTAGADHSAKLTYLIGPMNDLTVMSDEELIEELYKVLLPLKFGEMIDKIPSIILGHGDQKLINFIKRRNLTLLFRNNTQLFETLSNADGIMFVRAI